MLSSIDFGGICVLSALTLTIFVVYSHVSMSIQRKGEAPVRWSWIPFLGFAIEMGQHPIELLRETGDKLGEIFGLVVAGNRMFIINDCHSHHVILKPIKELSYEEFHHSVLENFFGTQAKTLHDRVLNEDMMRKWYSQYLLSDTALHALTARMQSQLTKSVVGVPAATVPLFDFIGRLVFQASVATLLNEEAGNDKDLYAAFLAFDQQLPIAAAGISVKYFATARNARSLLTAACGKYTTGMCELMTRRWALFEELDMPMVDRLAFQLAIVWASVGNTVPTAFWLLFHLLSDRELWARAKREVEASFAAGGGPLGCNRSALSQDQLNGMVFLDACITETLRLASGSLIMRFVQRQCDLTLASGNTYRFRKGDRVGLFPTATHLDEEVFPHAATFDPDRWLVGSTKEEVAAAALGRKPLFKGGKEIANNAGFLPFGGGTLLCPGRRFARNEVKTLLAFLITRFDLALEPGAAHPGFDNSRAGIGIFPPKGDVSVTISPL